MRTTPPKTKVGPRVSYLQVKLSFTIITKITKLSTSPQEISNAISIFVKSCDQNVSSFWSHGFLFLSFGIFEFRYININITTTKDCVAVNSKVTQLISCCNISTFR